MTIGFNSSVQIVANAAEFKNGNKGFKVEIKGMEGKLNASRSFANPLKAMRYMFLLSKKLELQINSIDLAAVSIAYQKAKAELSQASNKVNEVAAASTSIQSPSLCQAFSLPLQTLANRVKQSPGSHWIIL